MPELQEIDSHTKKLEFLFWQISEISDDELKSHWARYLCILVSGYIENYIKIVLKQYAKDKATPPIVKFVETKIQDIRNLKNERIKNLLQTFSEDWASEYNKQVAQKLKESIDSIIANRNRIAHGESTSISYVAMNNYFQDTKAALSKIQTIVLG